MRVVKKIAYLAHIIIISLVPRPLLQLFRRYMKKKLEVCNTEKSRNGLGMSQGYIIIIMMVPHDETSAVMLTLSLSCCWSDLLSSLAEAVSCSSDEHCFLKSAIWFSIASRHLSALSTNSFSL